MAETTLPDIFDTPAAFRALWNDLVVVRKVNRDASATAADARRKAIAQWGNLLDGLLLRLTDQVSGAARNVRVYGAIGDGITDDTDAIQDAIDAVDEAGGGVVFFPLGDYLHEGFAPAAGVRLVYIAGDDPNTLELLGADGDVAVAVLGATPLYVKTGGTGTSGWVPIGGGEGEATSVFGRSAGTAGERADIPFTADEQVLARRSGTLGAHSITILVQQIPRWETAREVDLGLWTPTDFAAGGDGSYSRDGGDGALSWAVGSTANANSASGGTGVFAGSASGIRIAHDPSVLTAMSNSLRSAPRLTIPVESLIPNYDPTIEYLIVLHIGAVATSGTVTTAPGVFLGLAEGAGDTGRWGAANLLETGNWTGYAQYNGLFSQHPFSPAFATPSTGTNSIAIMFGPRGASAWYGRYDGGWPAPSALRQTAQIPMQGGSGPSRIDCWNEPSMLVAIGLASRASYTGWADITMRRMLVLRRTR
jgi:hypothetical protein